jgi:hypothetical protein
MIGWEVNSTSFTNTEGFPSFVTFHKKLALQFVTYTLPSVSTATSLAHCISAVEKTTSKLFKQMKLRECEIYKQGTK